jgi:hypothetical protein
MANYTVKTTDNRNLVIEADSYALDYPKNAYDFIKNGKKVASVPLGGFFAIVLDDSVKSDHYYIYDWNEEDEKEADVCNDCRTAELLESEPFWDAVWEVVDAYHAPDDPEPNSPDGPAPETPYQITSGIWGFWYHDAAKGDVFVPYGNTKEDVQEGLERHRSGYRGWYTDQLNKTTPVSETIQ